MSCGPSKEAQPAPSLKVENFIEGEASPALVGVALAAIEMHRTALQEAGVTTVNVMPFVFGDMITIEPVGGNKEKSDAAIHAITTDINQMAQHVKQLQGAIPFLKDVELNLPTAENGAIYRCFGSPIQTVIDARPVSERNL